MKSSISWHFPRLDTAETILDLLNSGATSAITVFAPRNMGKTEMLMEDLWPLAKSRGYDVRYASFWQNKKNPELVFLEALSSSQRTIEQVKGRIGLAGNFLEASIFDPAGKSKTKNNTDNLLSEITGQFKKLKSRKKPVLLLLDEIQHLATDEKFDPFVAALRTLLDTSKKNVHTVFTGSSQDGLMAMFKRQKAPLFNFSHQFNLPELGSSFVKHMLDAFSRASGAKMDFTAAIRVFNAAHRNPARFHDLLRSLLISGRTDIETAYQEYSQRGPDAEYYQAIWTALKPLDRVVLTAIAEVKDGLYSQQQRDLFAREIGVEEIGKSAVQKSVERLKEEAVIVSYDRGRYRFADLGFEDFVLSR